MQYQTFSQGLADVLVNQFLSQFGCSLELHSGQGRNYELQLFTETMKLLGIHKTRYSPYHPVSNGMVERTQLHSVAYDFGVHTT